MEVEQPQSSPNFMQRVFDALNGSPELLTLDEIAARARLDITAVEYAIRRLRVYRMVVAVRHPDRQWRYGLNASAQRPSDRRGMRKDR
jgi:hypothetical protein